MSNEDQLKILVKEGKLEPAMRYWVANIQAMLDQEYGKNKIGHILILFPFGGSVPASWISNAKRQSVVQMLRNLADHIESPEARIKEPH